MDWSSTLPKSKGNKKLYTLAIKLTLHSTLSILQVVNKFLKFRTLLQAFYSCWAAYFSTTFYCCEKIPSPSDLSLGHLMNSQLVSSYKLHIPNTCCATCSNLLGKITAMCGEKKITDCVFFIRIKKSSGFWLLTVEWSWEAIVLISFISSISIIQRSL